MKLITFIATLLFICSITIPTHAQTTTGSEILILDEDEPLPDSARLIGDIRVGGGMASDCGYVAAMMRAKNKARDKRGNIVKITEIRYPDGLASCVRIRADVYYAPHADVLVRRKERSIDSAINALVPDTASYALLYVYRPRNSTGALIEYNLHVDDSVVCRVYNNSKFIIRLPRSGENRIWARTEARKEVPLRVRPGKAYFLKCSVKMGVMVGQPHFDVVDPYEGYMEFFKGMQGEEKRPINNDSE